MTRHLGLGVPLSLALHVGLGALALTLVSRPDAERALFIDLTVTPQVDAPRLPAPPAAPAPPTARRSRDSERSLAPRRVMAARAESSSPPAAPPVPSPAPVVHEIAPQRPGERAAEPATDSGPAVPPVTALAPEPASPMPGPGPARAAVGDAQTRSVPDAVRSLIERQPEGVAADRAVEAQAGARAARSSGAGGGAQGAGDARAVGPAAGGGAGRASGTAAASATAGSADTPGAEYGSYLSGIRRHIAESLRYPLSARRRRLTGTVQLEIVIRADGAIATADVVASSSHAILDDAAVETVRSLAPVPFPSNLPPRTLRVRLPVVFTLE